MSQALTAFKSITCLVLVCCSLISCTYTNTGGQSRIETPLSTSQNTTSDPRRVFGAEKTKVTYFQYLTKNQLSFYGFSLSGTNTKAIQESAGIIGINTLKKNRAILSLADDSLHWHTRNNSRFQYFSNKIKFTPHPNANLYLINASVKGHSMHFLVDSGATRSILSTTSATLLRTELRRSSATITGVHNKSRSANITGTLQMYLKNTIRPVTKPIPIRFFVTNLDQFSEKLDTDKGIKINGILGYDFLKQNFKSIDFHTETITLK